MASKEAAMSMQVLVEPLPDGSGYRASTGAPLHITATGATPEAALEVVGRQVAEKWDQGARLYTLPTVPIYPPTGLPPPTDEEMRDFWTGVEDVRRQYEERDRQRAGMSEAPPAA
jgi:hypothetical protein